MDERPVHDGQSGNSGHALQRALFETTSALAESSTLEDAAPRMLKADAKRWAGSTAQYGRWNRARDTLRCCRDMGRTSLQLAEFTAATRGAGIRTRSRIARTCLGECREPTWIRDVSQR